MKPQDLTTWHRLPTIAALAVVVLCTAFVTEAGATCFEKPLKPGAVPNLMFGGHNAGAPSFDDKEPIGGRDSFVGMWSVNLFIGEGPELFDIGFQQFHPDGTEFNLSGGLPPALGNVCIGVWKHVEQRTIKLHHVAFNWDSDGRNRGTFLLLATLRLDRHGNSYRGKYVADSFDLNGEVIPAEHFEGVMKATRITVD
jgi:hypothetical protein